MYLKILHTISTAKKSERLNYHCHLVAYDLNNNNFPKQGSFLSSWNFTHVLSKLPVNILKRDILMFSKTNN